MKISFMLLTSAFLTSLQWERRYIRFWQWVPNTKCLILNSAQWTHSNGRAVSRSQWLWELPVGLVISASSTVMMTEVSEKRARLHSQKHLSSTDMPNAIPSNLIPYQEFLFNPMIHSISKFTMTYYFLYWWYAIPFLGQQKLSTVAKMSLEKS
jgi:hypothetical protein